MVIGITGGIGCGKSTILGILSEKYDAHIIDADKVAHMLMEPGTDVYEEIKEYFGTGIIGEDNHINRVSLSKIVFLDKEKLGKLNKIVHPAVKKAIINEIADIMKMTPDKLIAVEAALFIEAGYMDICEELWYIYTDSDIRIERLMSSRGYSKEKATGIMANQLSDEEFRKHCTYVIDNSYSKENTLMQIANTIEKGE